MTLSQNLLKWILLLVGTAAIVYLCLLMLRPFADVLAWSIVLVILFEGVHLRLVARTGRPSLSALISSLLVVIVILMPVLFIVGLAVNEGLAVKDALTARFQEGIDLRTVGPVRGVMEWLSRNFGLDASALIDAARSHASALGGLAAQYSFAFASGATDLIVSFFLTIFTMFYLFRDGARIARTIPDFLPLERTQSELMLSRIRDVINGSLYGVIVIAIIQGGLGGAMFWVLGVPSALLWGVVMVVASLIPMVGSGIVWVPAAIYLAATGHWQKAAILAAWGAVVISSVDNFLRPKLVGGRVGLNELVMFFAVLGGLQVFGVLGIVLGPVAFAIAGSLLEALGRSDATEPPSTPAADIILTDATLADVAVAGPAAAAGAESQA